MEKSEQNSANSGPARISRRQFLRKGAGLTLALTLTSCGINPPPTIYKPDLEPASTPEEIMKQEIEREFNVELLTLRDLWHEVGSEYPDGDKYPDSIFNYYKKVPKVWDLERLTLLREGLSKLPPHMYTPNAEGKKLRIVLSYGNGSHGSLVRENGHVKERLDPKSHQVTLDHREFKIGSSKEPFDILAHELTHIATPETLVTDSYVLDAKTYYYGKTVSPWFDTIYEILGRDFFEGKRHTPLQNRLQGLQENNTDSEKKYFYENLDYAISNNYNPSEFIGVMGSSYIHGRNYFFSMYGAFFPPEIVSKLYDFIKDGVYRGTEFSTFPTKSYRAA